MRTLCLCGVAALALTAGIAARADYFVEDGDFETGAFAPSWAPADPHYPDAPATLFNGRLIPEFPMLEHFGGTHSVGWHRSDGSHNWPGHSSTDDLSGFVRQTWTL